MNNHLPHPQRYRFILVGLTALFAAAISIVFHTTGAALPPAALPAAPGPVAVPTPPAVLAARVALTLTVPDVPEPQPVPTPPSDDFHAAAGEAGAGPRLPGFPAAGSAPALAALAAAVVLLAAGSALRPTRRLSRPDFISAAPKAR